MKKNKLFIVLAIATVFLTSCGENNMVKSIESSNSITEEDKQDKEPLEEVKEEINPEVELENFKKELQDGIREGMTQDEYDSLIKQLADKYSTVKNYPSYDIYKASREVSKKILDNQLTVEFVNKLQLGQLNEFDLNSIEAKQKVYELYKTELDKNLKALEESYSYRSEEDSYNDMLIFNPKFELEWLKPLKDNYLDDIYKMVKEDANRLGIEETEHYKSLKLPLMCQDDIILYFVLNASEEDISKIYSLSDIVGDDIPEVVQFLTNEIAYYKSDALYSPSEELSYKELHGVSDIGEIDEYQYLEFTGLIDTLLGYTSDGEVGTGWVSFAEVFANNWLEDMSVFANYEFPINDKYEQILWGERIDKITNVYNATKNIWEECQRQTEEINKGLKSDWMDNLPSKPLDMNALNPYIEDLQKALSQEPIYHQDGQANFLDESIGLIQTTAMGHTIATIESIRDKFGL